MYHGSQFIERIDSVGASILFYFFKRNILKACVIGKTSERNALQQKIHSSSIYNVLPAVATRKASV